MLKMKAKKRQGSTEHEALFESNTLNFSWCNFFPRPLPMQLERYC